MDYLILILATWRVSSLITNEDGPHQFFERLRRAAGVKYETTDRGNVRYGSNQFSIGLLCVWCNSVWAGATLGALYTMNASLALTVSLPFALSAGAVLFDEVIGRIKWQ